MSLAVLTGRGGPEELQRLAGFALAVHLGNVCVSGAWKVDEEEKEIVKESELRVFTMDEEIAASDKQDRGAPAFLRHRLNRSDGLSGCRDSVVGDLTYR